MTVTASPQSSDAAACVSPPVVGVGCEWMIDAQGCDPELLQSLTGLVGLCERVVEELGLTVCGPPLWRRFPAPGGVTGLYLLSESHLSCHTWPEHGLATFNLFCCRRRRDWPWAERLRELLEAQVVQVRCVERGVGVKLHSDDLVEIHAGDTVGKAGGETTGGGS